MCKMCRGISVNKTNMPVVVECSLWQVVPDNKYIKQLNQSCSILEADE